MGQKIHPIGARVGVIRPWSTRWYANKKNFADMLNEDYQLREMLLKRLSKAGAQVSHIDIERAGNKITVNLHTGRPGVVIGRGGAGVEDLKKEIEKFTGGKTVVLNIIEIKVVEMSAQLVAESIAQQLERRISFRRAMKQSIGRAMKSGAKGIKCMVAGRLGGAEIARSEKYREGSIPLQTLRANIDYGFAEAHTTFGRIGVKVWIYKGQVLPSAKKAPAKARAEGGK